MPTRGNYNRIPQNPLRPPGVGGGGEDVLPSNSRVKLVREYLPPPPPTLQRALKAFCVDEGNLTVIVRRVWRAVNGDLALALAAISEGQGQKGLKNPAGWIIWRLGPGMEINGEPEPVEVRAYRVHLLAAVIEQNIRGLQLLRKFGSRNPFLYDYCLECGTIYRWHSDRAKCPDREEVR